MLAPSTRSLIAFAILALVACGGGGDSVLVPLPAKLGARVVYVADTDSSADWSYGDEIWAADSGSTAMSVTKISSGTDGRYLYGPVVSPGGVYLGARVATFMGSAAPEYCPGGYQLFEAATGLRSDYLRDDHCAAEIAFSPTGDSVAVRYYFHGLAPARLAIGDVPGFLNTIHEIGHPDGYPPEGRFRYSSDGSTLVWQESSGLYSSIGSVAAAAIGYFRTADTSHPLYLTPDGSRAAYAASAGIFRVTDMAPSAPLSSTDLIAPLAAGSYVGLASLSPTGTHLLYSARISGQWQLWLVALNAPLSEQRVDTAAPLYLYDQYAPPPIAWSPDGARFAWGGDGGGAHAQLFYAELATPTNAIALSPGTEGPPRDVQWTDDETIAYSYGGAFRSLRAVMITAPLTTYPLTAALGALEDVRRFALCSDGRVVSLVTKDAGVVTLPEDVHANSRLYSAQPRITGSAVQITPTIGPGPNFDNSGISDFACEP